jgi:hypothetical protein
MEVMDLEYILFAVGLVVIVVSLFLTYRSQQDNDDYYLANEMLSEIRNLKEELEDEINAIVGSNDFGQMLNHKLDNGRYREEIIILKDRVEKLIDKVEDIDIKMDKLDKNIKDINVLNNQLNTKPTLNPTNQNPAYQQIKNLKEEGLSMAEIAKKMNMGSREVELIYKFNNRREN